MPDYQLEQDGSYRINQYDSAAAFCSFLPGIGGPAGVPLWCMYVNRAQAIVSFGVHNKDNAICEYLPATWAYQLVGIQGFRTFCKIDGNYYEPFRAPADGRSGAARAMHIEPDHLTLRETAAPHGLSFTVRYFAPVNQPLGTLCRRLTITNTGDEAKSVEALDGLPLILPAGFTDHGIKTMRHIHEAYAAVRLTCGHVPFFASKVHAHDEAEVTEVRHGNFYAAWTVRDGGLVPVEPYVDPHVIFGGGHDLISPRRFIAEDALSREQQIWENRLPCALAPISATLEPGASIELVALVGTAPSEKRLEAFLPRYQRIEDLDAAREESRRLFESLVTPAFTVSRYPTFDAYARQNYLDNVLRGGRPEMLPSRSGPTPLYLYARRHGDLERDYNYFVLPPTPLSSGAGNYRDVCQNRRSDVWFYPDPDATCIRMFVELLQPDGYNPLSVEGYRWRLGRDVDPLRHCPATDTAARDAFRTLLDDTFVPGELLHWAQRYAVPLDQPRAWLERVLGDCERSLVANGHAGGYWIDHWTYIIDLLEAFAAVYPDRVEQMLTGAADVGWFDEGASVASRHEKYVRRGDQPLQLNAVQTGRQATAALPPTTILGKLCALVAIKAISFDYAGRGIEMEAGRPGWNDSLNGLPGLFGSSTCEAAELTRLAAWLRAALPSAPNTELPVEIADLIVDVVADLKAPTYDWDRAAGLRERCRARLYGAGGGETRVVSGTLLTDLLAGAESRGRRATKNSIDSARGLIHTYYVGNPQSHPDETIGGFASEPLPLYLEGQVHWLRIQRSADDARAIYQAVRNSPLFDQALRMYKLNECLDGQPPEIGRARTFTRGWFENESIWLHMSYKFLLELLRAGLHAEFFEDIRTMFVPFMNPETYGRSTLENSSFIGSSANPDPHTHGRGFIARLSGSTAEFIHMWLLMTVGQRPFHIENDTLHFQLEPVLPGEWFTTQPETISWQGEKVEIPVNAFACALLGNTLLVYHNPTRANTFGPNAVRPVDYVLDGCSCERQAAGLAGELAERVRARAFTRIDVHLA